MAFRHVGKPYKTCRNLCFWNSFSDHYGKDGRVLKSCSKIRVLKIRGRVLGEVKNIEVISQDIN